MNLMSAGSDILVILVIIDFIPLTDAIWCRSVAQSEQCKSIGEIDRGAATDRVIIQNGYCDIDHDHSVIIDAALSCSTNATGI